MFVFIIGVAVCILVFLLWELMEFIRVRRSVVRRRRRVMRGIARQKAWDIVFGRRAQRRLPYYPPKAPED